MPARSSVCCPSPPYPLHSRGIAELRCPRGSDTSPEPWDSRAVTDGRGEPLAARPQLRGDYGARSRGCRREGAGAAGPRLTGFINALLAPFSFQSRPLASAAPALAGKGQSRVRVFSLRCRTAFLPFPGARGHGRSQGTGGRAGVGVRWHFSLPCPLPLPVIQSPWSPEGFFWMPTVGSALLVLLLFVTGNF